MSLRGKVVVVTGASSGIGRAASIRFAARGARVVLAARRREALEDVALECRVVGGDAIVCPADVTSEVEVQGVVKLALEQLGRIDVWVNNAGVTLFGSLEEAPMAEHRRVIETNLFGAIYGARAVVPVFRRQQRGVLINVGSILSKIGQPFVPSYVISKFGLRGLSEALRAELADQPDIHVCSFLPYAVDTEHFESGANHVGLPAHPLPPVQPPEKVADELVRLAERPVRERHIPRAAVFGLALHALFPRTVERIIADALARYHFSDAAQAEATGNLYGPRPGERGVHGQRPPRLNAAGMIAFAARRFVAVPAELAVRAALKRTRLFPGSLDGSPAGSGSPESKARRAQGELRDSAPTTVA
jgi:NAD(P)-dependent dehydrogenase (short-subunit alcohol dehydrogenase family)